MPIAGVTLITAFTPPAIVLSMSNMLSVSVCVLCICACVCMHFCEFFYMCACVCMHVCVCVCVCVCVSVSPINSFLLICPYVTATRLTPITLSKGYVTLLSSRVNNCKQL